MNHQPTKFVIQNTLLIKSIHFDNAREKGKGFCLQSNEENRFFPGVTV